MKSASADLRANELQDLAEAMGDITKAAAGHDIKYTVRIDLGGEKPAPDSVVEEVNIALAKASKKLKLE